MNDNQNPLTPQPVSTEGPAGVNYDILKQQLPKPPITILKPKLQSFWKIFVIFSAVAVGGLFLAGSLWYKNRLANSSNLSTEIQKPSTQDRNPYETFADLPKDFKNELSIYRLQIDVSTKTRKNVKISDGVINKDWVKQGFYNTDETPPNKVLTTYMDLSRRETEKKIVFYTILESRPGIATKTTMTNLPAKYTEEGKPSGEILQDFIAPELRTKFKYVSEETVNGLPSLHFRNNETQTSIWVARDYGLATKVSDDDGDDIPKGNIFGWIGASLPSVNEPILEINLTYVFKPPPSEKEAKLPEGLQIIEGQTLDLSNFPVPSPRYSNRKTKYQIV